MVWRPRSVRDARPLQSGKTPLREVTISNPVTRVSRKPLDCRYHMRS